MAKYCDSAKCLVFSIKSVKYIQSLEAVWNVKLGKGEKSVNIFKVQCV